MDDFSNGNIDVEVLETLDINIKDVKEKLASLQREYLRLIGVRPKSEAKKDIQVINAKTTMVDKQDILQQLLNQRNTITERFNEELPVQKEGTSGASGTKTKSSFFVSSAGLDT